MSNDPYNPQSPTMTQEAAHQAGEVTDHATAEAADVKDHALDSVRTVTDTAAEEARSLAHEARSEVRGLLDSSLAEISSQASTGQHRLAAELRTVVDEIDEMAHGSQKQGVVTDLARDLGQRGSDLVEWLETHEPGEALDEVRRYAARNPWTFLAIAAGAGMLVGRFARGMRDEGTPETDQPRSIPDRPVDPHHYEPELAVHQTPAAVTEPGFGPMGHPGQGYPGPGHSQDLGGERR